MAAPARFHRPTIGVLALLLIAGGAAMQVWLPTDESQPWIAACWRVGPVMALLWLAHPQLARVPAWLILVGIALLFLALVFARQPRVLVMAAAVLLVIMRLRPRGAAVAPIARNTKEGERGRGGERERI